MAGSGLSDEDPDLAIAIEGALNGHDAGNGHLHLTIPELAGAQTLAAANARGSRQARTRARVLAWLLIVGFVLPLVLVVVGGLFSLF